MSNFLIVFRRRAVLLAILSVIVLAGARLGALTWTGTILGVAGDCRVLTCAHPPGGGHNVTPPLANATDVFSLGSGGGHSWLVADAGNHIVLWYADNFFFAGRVAGLGVAGNDATHLDTPTGIAVSNGVVYIADSGNHRIQKTTLGPFLSDTNPMTTVAGTGTPGFAGDGGPAENAMLNQPLAVAVDPRNADVYIADTLNFRIRRVSAATGIIDTVAGTGVSGFSGDGGPATDAQISRPFGLDVDAHGIVYVADFDNRRIRAIDTATGIIRTAAGDGTAGSAGDGWLATAAQLNQPSGVRVDGAGNFYISDMGERRVRRVLASTGIIKTVAGGAVSGPLPGSTDGLPATAAQLAVVRNSSVDARGDLYIADGTRIQRVDGVPPRLPKDVPLLGDIDGDGRSDLVMWSVATGTFRWLTSSTGYSSASAGTKQWGNAGLGDVPMLGDIDGDGKSDLIVWRATTGTWYWLTSSSGYDYAAANGKRWGDQTEGDVPFVGDVDGDRRADLVVWRESTGVWYWLTSASGYDYAASAARAIGDQRRADVPLLGDVDGDGRADPAVWSADTGTFRWFASATGAGAIQWGTRSLRDVPMLADIDGDRRADLVIWRPDSGTWYWLTAASGFAYARADGRQFGSGIQGDTPIAAGDFDGDGTSDLAVFRTPPDNRAPLQWFWSFSSARFTDIHGRPWP